MCGKRQAFQITLAEEAPKPRSEKAIHVFEEAECIARVPMRDFAALLSHFRGWDAASQLGKVRGRRPPSYPDFLHNLHTCFGIHPTSVGHMLYIAAVWSESPLQPQLLRTEGLLVSVLSWWRQVRLFFSSRTCRMRDNLFFGVGKELAAAICLLQDPTKIWRHPAPT